jgi:hypothetical protein
MLSPSEYATWACRLDVESGRLRPYQVDAAPLPADVSAIARTSFNGFVYLLRCRGAAYPVAPAPWTAEFAGWWCGISPRLAKDARLELAKLGALVHVGDWKRAKLWLPWGVAS